MQQRMKRAKMMNRVMTVVFYAIAGFFLLLREALEISCLIPFTLCWWH